MTDLSVGTLTTSGTRTIVTGTSSGLNTAAIIENAVNANNIKADNIDVRINSNQTKITAYERYFGLTQALQTSLFALKSVNSRSGVDTNVFQSRVGSLTSNGASASGLIVPTINSNAAAGTYNIQVIQKAEVNVIGSQNITSSTADLNLTGSFQIGLNGRTPSTINVTADLSLQEIAAAINITSATSGVSASVLKISETEFQLILRGSDTNVDIEVTTLSGNVLGDLGFTDGADNFLPAQISQAAQGSIILFNSTQITRDGNTYDDIINGVSLNVIGEAVGTTVTLTVDNDASSAKTAVLDFINSFNNLRDFFLDNQTVGTGGILPEEAVLFSDSLVDNLSLALSNSLTRDRSSSSIFGSIRNLGITLNPDNRLVLSNETALDDALINNFDEVRKFFSTTATVNNANLGLINNTSTAQRLDFEINITVNASGNITSATVPGAGNAFQVESGNRLVGREGTPYAGLTFAYIGTTNATISVSLRAGLADQLSNSIEPYTSPSSSLIAQQIAQLKGTNDELGLRAEAIRDRGEVIREQQIQKYSALEARLASLKTLLTQIRAILGTDKDK